MDTNTAPDDPYDQGIPVTMIREAALLKTIRHENVIDLREILIRRGAIIFVLELCSCNLRQHLGELKSQQATTMTPAQLRSYTRQILSAVAFFHDRRILHRDMKPDNILLDATREHIKIADFGMARPFTSHRSYTGRCVTAWYRPPEIILGDTQYGPAVDIWSTGCIFAEMINLYPVFRCNTEFECLILAFQSLGTPTDAEWPGVSRLPNYLADFPKWRPQTAESIIDIDASQVCPGALALLCEMLKLDPKTRITAHEALDRDDFFVPAQPTTDDVDTSILSAAATVSAPGEDSDGEAEPCSLLEADQGEHGLSTKIDDSGDASSDSSAPTPAAQDRDEAPPVIRKRGRDLEEPAVFVSAAGEAPQPGVNSGGSGPSPSKPSPSKRGCASLGRPAGACGTT
jgi:cyclin-dependent kinase 2